ncbi:MAG: hypothetical protein OJF55_000804 [Rhodanobacteraceae bacterium]|jgi:hypothetical protein|nr:MAG: hypothetical protein OJF55_000804 [Rhodanobacteraceae bacterium]
MLAFPIMAVLAANAAAQFPDGFTAHCTKGVETTAVFSDKDPSHPSLNPFQPDDYNLTLSYRNGRFSVELAGADFMVVQTNDGNHHDFNLVVLKSEPGDLVLSVQTSAWGHSLTVYHLRYAGQNGALTIAKTNYYGHDFDETSLSVLSCKIGAQPSS